MLSTIKIAPNPRCNIEMFDCIMEYVRQCYNVESTLNLLKCIISIISPNLSCFSLDPRSFNNGMKVFEKLMNEFVNLVILLIL